MIRVPVQFRDVEVYVDSWPEPCRSGDGDIICIDIGWRFVNPDLEALILSDVENDAILDQLREVDA